MRTRVAQSAQQAVSNQAELAFGDVVVRSDDPATDEADDATVLTIEARRWTLSSRRSRWI